MEEARTTAIQAVKEEVRIQAWQEDVKAQQSSGLTIREWCRQNGIKENVYYYRLRRIRSKFLEKAPAIVPVRAAETSVLQGTGITLEKNGLNIKLPSDVSAETLIALVKELC